MGKGKMGTARAGKPLSLPTYLGGNYLQVSVVYVVMASLRLGSRYNTFSQRQRIFQSR
jgi:hypothetical protein